MSKLPEYFQIGWIDQCDCQSCDYDVAMRNALEIAWEAIIKTREGFTHLGAHCKSAGDRQGGLPIYGLGEYAFDRRNEVDEAMRRIEELGKVGDRECNCEDLRTCQSLYGNAHGAETELKKRERKRK